MISTYTYIYINIYMYINNSYLKWDVFSSRPFAQTCCPIWTYLLNLDRMHPQTSNMESLSRNHPCMESTGHTPGSRCSKTEIFSLYSPIVFLVTLTSVLCDPISVRQLGVSLVNTAWCDEAVMRMRTTNLIMMFHFMWEFKICFLLSSAKDLLTHVCRGLNYTVYQSINYYLHWWCQY